MAAIPAVAAVNAGARGVREEAVLGEESQALFLAREAAVVVGLMEAAVTLAAEEWVGTRNRRGLPRSPAIRAATACRSTTPRRSKRHCRGFASAIPCTSICPMA